MTFKEVIKNQNEEQSFKNGYDSELIDESSYDSASSYEEIHLEDDQELNDDPAVLPNIQMSKKFSHPINIEYC